MLTGVVVFLLLLIALLAIPITVTFQLSWRQVFQNDIKLQWAFGLVRVRIRPRQPKLPSPKGEEPEQRIGRIERTLLKKQNVFAVVRQKKIRRRIIRFINDMWHAVRKKNLSLRVRVGLGDPADTGQFWTLLGPVAGILSSVQEASIIIEPEFIDMTFELDSSGSIRVIPLQMIYLTVALLLSPLIWQGIKQMRIVGH